MNNVIDIMIPNQKLREWQEPGDQKLSMLTYELIQSVFSTELKQVDFHLQGSYANHTNVKGDSDVDILLICDDFAQEYKLSLPNLKDAVFKRLSSYDCFSRGKKTIKFNGKGGFLRADIIPCLTIKGSLESGISLYDSSTRSTIVNYPIQHKMNGERKNKETNGLFKPTVRMYKNIRNELVNHGRMRSDLVSSYNLESLIYNVDNTCFDNDPRFCLLHTHLDMMVGVSSRIHYDCQNGKMSLLDYSGDCCWNYNDAYAFLSLVSRMDMDW